MYKRQLCSTRNALRFIFIGLALFGAILLYKSKFAYNTYYCNSSKDCYELLKDKAKQFQQYSGINEYFIKDQEEEQKKWNKISETSMAIDTVDNKVIIADDDDDDDVSPEELEYQRLTNTSLPRVKGAFVVLARNSELYALRSSMRYLEDRFNRKYNYPWIFLNEQPFTEEFKELTSMMTNAQVYYGLVPEEHWSYPEWIDKEHAAECRKDLENRGILYGGSESYRHMCRYQSGFFMLHPLLDDIDYYW
ncbi:Putative Glycolipid 2-alpha-mannosyltransferase [Rhizopus microsporus]|nr:Putative Glycolipid 2-alpha-mannosyltransferase [Rhizopus microsporus]